MKIADIILFIPDFVSSLVGRYLVGIWTDFDTADSSICFCGVNFSC